MQVNDHLSTSEPSKAHLVALSHNLSELDSLLSELDSIQLSARHFTACEYFLLKSIVCVTKLLSDCGCKHHYKYLLLVVVANVSGPSHVQVTVICVCYMQWTNY